ncbi:MAG TPA: ATP-dependent Clp protease proteolytic subunit [Coleofasciculaceae cyanobacterium]
MNLPIQAVQSQYYGDAYYRQPPPDLPSLLLKERIVYLGRQLYPDVTIQIIAQLLYLHYDAPDKPIKIYINSMGEYPGLETAAFAICDTMNYIKPPIHTICIGVASGLSALILAAGTKGFRASLPHAEILLHDASGGTRGQATDIQIAAQEVLTNRKTMIDLLCRHTGQSPEKIRKDIDRQFFMAPEEAKEYGIIDRILESESAVPKSLTAGTI